jgi:single-stranded DNA-specific DHH superfamily exonuclease
VDATAFLTQMSDLFLNFGGHNAAAGFSFTVENTADVLSRLKELAPLLEL